MFVAVLAVLGLTALNGGAIWRRLPEPVKVHRPAARHSPEELPERARAGIDEVVDTVAHRVSPAPGRPGVLHAGDDRYAASFDDAGFSFTPAGADGQGVRITTREMRRGERPLALAPKAWRADANTASRSLGHGAVERVTARSGEVEWDVELQERLPGTGPLVVEAHVDGSSGAVRIGEAVIVDATGAELHRAPLATSGRSVRLEVPASVLDEATYPLTIDPTVSPEHPVSDPVTANAPGFQEDPAVAFDGTNHLAVWSDRRSGYAPEVFAARVSASGAVLDPTGIPVIRGATSPAVAFDGTNYLVAFMSLTSSYPLLDIAATRVSKAGIVLDPSGFTITRAAGNQSSPAVAFTGKYSVVAWEDGRFGGTDVYAARVDLSGTILDPSGIAVSTAAGDQRDPSVASNGTDALVVWADERSGTSFDIRGARVTETGGVLDPSGIDIASGAGDQLHPAVAFGGSYLVVWQGGAGGSFDIRSAIVRTNGTVFLTGLVVSTAAGDQTSPAVTFAGTDYLVVWGDQRSGSVDVYGTRVTTLGSARDPSGIVIAGSEVDQVTPAIAYGGGSALVLWTDVGAGPSLTDIAATRLSTAGTVTSTAGIVVSTAANPQSAAAVAFDGTNYFVAWEDRRSPTSSDIYAGRVSPAGVLLDGTGIAVSTAPGDQRAPAVAFDGSNYLVVWEDYPTPTSPGLSDVYGARVSKAGAVVGSVFAVSAAAPIERTPAVAFDGNDFLVVWEDGRAGTGGDIYGARVSRAGSLLDPAGRAITTASTSQDHPAVAFDGTNSLVVWEDDRSGGSNIYGARVTPGGAILDPSGILINESPGEQRAPAVAFDGTNHLVVWIDLPRAGLYGTRISPAGDVQDAGVEIAKGAGTDVAPTVAANGSFLVVWQSRGDLEKRPDIVEAVRVGADGRPQQAGVIAEVAMSFDVPAVAAGPAGNGRFAVTHGRYVDRPPYGSARVFLHTYSAK